MLPNLISDHTKDNNGTLVTELNKDFSKCDPGSASAALRGMAARIDHSHLLSQIDVPTLLVFGEHDKVTNMENAERMEKMIPNSKLAIVENAGHYSNLENPSGFNSSLCSFLKSL